MPGLPIHLSAFDRFRSPTGAVCCGTEITLKLAISVADGGREAALIVENGGSSEKHALICTGERFGEAELYSVSIRAPETPAVLWYYFITESGAKGERYQITVYAPEFKTPDWAKSAVMYQIFPDRFHGGNPETVRRGLEYHRSLGRSDIYLREDTGGLPDYLPNAGQKDYMPADIYGGDLAGILKRLPYLKSLGVSVLYLNPIFEAASNHRYNTADYMKTDPVLGTDEDFHDLVSAAGSLGIKIILDGVFSHTGDDSIYFNKYGRYKGEPGAYQSRDSRYYAWYNFTEYPDKYKSWWDFPSLPEVDEHSPSWREYIINGENSVIKTWLRRGAAGYRLDVADELPDDTIGEIRDSVKSENPEALIIGEVWEDATNKKSYGKPRTYALGRGLDSVMNYPFTDSVIKYLRGSITAREFADFLIAQNQNYPPEMYNTLMNLLSSHDIMRIRTALTAPEDIKTMSRADQARYMERQGGKPPPPAGGTPFQKGAGAGTGIALCRVAAAIQFTIPGIPSVYYGDETGMHGLYDPFNRLMFRESEPGLIPYYQKLGAIRHSESALSRGGAAFIASPNGVLFILRYDFSGSYNIILTAVNPGESERRAVIDLYDERECMSESDLINMRAAEFTWAVPLPENNPRPSGTPFEFEGGIPVNAGLLDITLAPLSAAIYRLI